MSTSSSRARRRRQRGVIPAVGWALCASAAPAMGMGFGTSQTLSTLGQTLDFSVQFALDGEAPTTLDCLAAEVYPGDGHLPQHVVRTRVVPGPDGGHPMLNVRTLVPMDEPVVTVVLNAGCPPRLSRRFVVFIDPAPSQPLTDAPNTGRVVDVQPALPLTLPDTDAISPAALLALQADPPLVPAGRLADDPPGFENALSAGAIASLPRQPRRQKPVGDAPVALAKPPARAHGRSQQRHTTLAHRRGPIAPPMLASAETPSTAEAAPVVSRLRLDAAPDAALFDQRSALATSQPAASAASAAASATPDAAAASVNTRIKWLEDNLARLQAESTQLRRNAQTPPPVGAGSSGRLSTWIWPLCSALLAGALVAVLWRRRHAPAPVDWRDAVDSVADPSTINAAETGPDRVAPSTFVRVVDVVPVGKAEATSPALRAASSVELPPAAIGTAAELAAAAAPTPDESSVEELIDLEQKFDFLSALGQDEQAVDLLSAHLHDAGGGHPLPYLKLLETYRRLGDETAYARIRTDFNERFRARAPAWDEPAEAGHELEHYAAFVTELVALWPAPDRAAHLLGAWLTRSAAANDALFDMPAFSDLLFLHSMAREMADRDARPVAVPPTLTVAAPVVEALDFTSWPIAPPDAAEPQGCDLDLELDLDLTVTPSKFGALRAAGR